MQTLHYKTVGDQGPHLCILHGLFGSLENWASQAKTLSAHFKVTSIDLRNHGRSPHFAQMGYREMAGDVLHLLDHLAIDKTHLLGHSMGGKTAMQFALDNTTRVDKLIVVDIAPKKYARHHEAIFNALDSINPATLNARNEADEKIKHAVPKAAIRTFWVQYLQRATHGFRWKMNLPVLRDDYSRIAAAIQSTQPFSGDTLFIKGGNSDYIKAQDQAAIRALFPHARAKIIENTGHWPHVEKAAVFAKIVIDFLSVKAQANKEAVINSV